jgi:uncharacterized glyoxalase superfamily protein PhnB
MAKKKSTSTPQIKGLDCLYLPTGKFEDAWRFWTEIAGGKAGKTWGEGEARSGLVQLGGQDIILGGDAETSEDQELGYPVRHGAATLYFSTPNLDKLYKDLANRGASILRGPLKTSWGSKVMTVKAGDAVIAFIETKKKSKGK